MITNIFVIVAFLVISKFFLNLFRLLQVRHFLSRYENYLQNPDQWQRMVQSEPQIRSLFEKAGVGDNFLPYVRFVGYGHVSTHSASVQHNLVVLNNEVVNLALRMFHQAMGVYRSRAIEAVNPLYWLDMLIMLPKMALGYLGVPAESILVRGMQLAYWAAVGVLGFLLSVYRPEVDLALRTWIASLTP